MPIVEFQIDPPTGGTISVSLNIELATLRDLKQAVKRETGYDVDEIELRRYDEDQELVDTSDEDEDFAATTHESVICASATAEKPQAKKHRTLLERGLKPKEQHQTSLKLRLVPHVKGELERALDKHTREIVSVTQAFARLLTQKLNAQQIAFDRQRQEQEERHQQNLQRITKELDDVKSSQRQCLQMLRSPQGLTAKQWFEIGQRRLHNQWSPTTEATVNAVEYSWKECYLNCLRLDPDFPDVEVWNNLGLTMVLDETIDINGVPYTKQDCYLKAISLDSSGGKGVHWHNLGTVTPQGSTVDVNGVSYTKQQCFVKALTINRKYKPGWTKLAGTLAIGDQIEVNGERLSKEECRRRGA